MPTLMTSYMPAAASMTLKPMGAAIFSSTALAAFSIEFHAPAGEEVGVQVAQHQVGVRAGGFGAPQAVAGRARVGARALRPHAQQAALVDPADGAAARADGDHVQHGPADAQAVDLALGGGEGLAVFDQGDVEAGAAHVAGDAVGEALALGVGKTGHRAAGGAGEQREAGDAHGDLGAR